MTIEATKIQNWRLKNPDFDKNMFRPQRYGAMDFFIRQSQSPNSLLNSQTRQTAFNSIGADVEIPVTNYDGTVTVSNVRSCTVPDNRNTTAIYTVVWATMQVGFTIVPTDYQNNNMTYNEDFGKCLDKMSKALANAIDTGCLTALGAHKTQVFKNSFFYPVVGNVVQVSWDLSQNILGHIGPMMRANDYQDQVHIVGNSGIDALIGDLSQKGMYNEINKQFEYNDKIFHFTNNLADEAGKVATFYAVTENQVDILTRVDREAKRGGRSESHVWDVVRLPYIDLPIGLHKYESVGDQSASAGEASADNKCAILEHWGFSLDVAYIVAYNSDPTTIANPIIKAEIEGTTIGAPYARPVRIVNDTNNPVYTEQVAP